MGLDVKSMDVARREKRIAAASSVSAAVFLTSFKLVIGLATGSLGILSEAAHSGLDLVAALVTFFAVRLSDRPPDAGHPYGHGKIENLSALVETLLLLLTCAWIIYEAIQRLFFKSVEVEASLWTFVVMGTSIVIDVSRSRMLYRAARKHNSQALEADALHFSTDIWSSSVVLAGLGLVWLGKQLGPRWTWLATADTLAALGVATIVVYVSVQLGQRAVAALIDAAPPGIAELIATQVSQVPGVEKIGSVRVRQSGASSFVDIKVDVDRSVSLEKAHQIATAVELAVTKRMPQADVSVHIDPAKQAGESLSQAIGAVAARMGLQVHNVRAHSVRGLTSVDLHIEVPPDMTLAEAHEQASRLEIALRKELAYLNNVHTHIEPLMESIDSPETEKDLVERMTVQIAALVEGIGGVQGCHNLHIRPADDGYDLVLHCFANPDLSVVEAHQLASEVERQLRAQVPDIAHVIAHVEPEREDQVWLSTVA